MSKTRSFSIYLLKNGQNPTTALEVGHPLTLIPTTALPQNAQLYFLDSAANPPWWRNYFGITQAFLPQSMKGAIVFIPVGQRWFALTFGHVYKHLVDTSYEYDFGLQVTLNSLDPTKLKSTDIVDPSASVRQRTQVPTESDLTYFDFDKDTSIIKSLTGKVRSDYQDLFKHATGSTNLRIGTDKAAGDLLALCQSLLTLYNSQDFLTYFPGIQNIQPVRDPSIISLLEQKLLEAVKAKDAKLALMVPDIINYNSGIQACFYGSGTTLCYDEVFIGNFYAYLQASNVTLPQMTLDQLKNYRLTLVDENGAVIPQGSFSILKCFIFDTSLTGNQNVYHYNDGSWYKVKKQYAQSLKTYLDSRFITLSLPDFNHPTEGDYNTTVATSDPTFINLDKTDIRPSGQTQIEPCDLYKSENTLGILYHIKVSTKSSALSHLFNQGTVSIDVLKREPESKTKMINLIRTKIGLNNEADYVAPINNMKLKVVYGIVTHQLTTKKSDLLPLFSKMTLKRSLDYIEFGGLQGAFGFIKDVKTQTQTGVKKTRKKKAPTPDAEED